jgi:phosphoglycerate dehydrogenase-like enzyme
MQAQCFDRADLERLRALCVLRESDVPECTEPWQVSAAVGADVIITGWGTQRITREMLEAAPDLKLICHGAGSVKHLIDADEFMRRNIRVCTARAALAAGVAEFAFGMMLVSMKGVWRLHAATSQGIWDRDAVLPFLREPYGATVGIVGASAVGREMIRLCKTLELASILLYDPYVGEEEAAALGVEKVELDDLMRRSEVVLVHTPATEQCRHIINARNLALLKDGAIFINTARGMCVDESALIGALQTRPILACLDVTEPEPPEPDSPLWRLPNCILTPHVAGAVKENILRQGHLVVEQIEAFVEGRAISGELDLRIHERLA